MDSKQKTLEALETFIQAQRALLARTQADIGRLNELKAQTIGSQPALDTLNSEVFSSTLSFHGQADIAAEVQQDIDWSLFKSHDPVGLRSLAIEVNTTHAARTQPGTTQRSPLSHLQQLVKDCRAKILDPFFSTYVPPSEDEASDNEITPEQARKERAREQIRALRRRRIGEGGLTLLPGVAGVYVRRDIVDESAEVDVGMDDGVPPLSLPVEAPMEVDSQKLPPPSPPPPPRAARSKPSASKAKPLPPGPSSRKKRSSPPPEPQPDPHLELPRPAKRARDSRKSETYKQAWSMSEQHLLERLLEEIPDGEKNRWAKISRAMGGRRTPRQVASRVQKYFEKLKRFGVDIVNGAGSSGTPADDVDESP